MKKEAKYDWCYRLKLLRAGSFICAMILGFFIYPLNERIQIMPQEFISKTIWVFVTLGSLLIVIRGIAMGIVAKDDGYHRHIYSSKSKKHD